VCVCECACVCVCFLLVVVLLVSTNAVDCLERLVSIMTCNVSSGTLKPLSRVQICVHLGFVLTGRHTDTLKMYM